MNRRAIFENPLFTFFHKFARESANSITMARPPRHWQDACTFHFKRPSHLLSTPNVRDNQLPSSSPLTNYQQPIQYAAHLGSPTLEALPQKTQGPRSIPLCHHHGIHGWSTQHLKRLQSRCPISKEFLISQFFLVHLTTPLIGYWLGIIARWTLQIQLQRWCALDVGDSALTAMYAGRYNGYSSSTASTVWSLLLIASSLLWPNLQHSVLMSHETLWRGRDGLSAVITRRGMRRVLCMWGATLHCGDNKYVRGVWDECLSSSLLCHKEWRFFSVGMDNWRF